MNCKQLKKQEYAEILFDGLTDIDFDINAFLQGTSIEEVSYLITMLFISQIRDKLSNLEVDLKHKPIGGESNV